MHQQIESNRQTVESALAERILIVDDDHLNLMLLEVLLKREGYQVVKADNGREAIDLLEEQSFAMVICDYRMPGISGAEVLKKALEHQPQAVRILLTGSNEISASLEAVNIGQISHLLTKPWEDHELLQVVRNSIEKYRLALENQRLQNLIVSQYKQLQESHQALKNKFDLGNRVHEALLIGKVPQEVPGVSIAADSFFSEESNGDYFDFFQPMPNVLDFVIGDVIGKGIPAALIGIAVKTQLARFILRPIPWQLLKKQKIWEEDLLTPEEILTKLQGEIVPQLRHMGCSTNLFFGRFNLTQKILTYLNCGLAKHIHYHAKTKKTTLLEGNNLPLGMAKEEFYESIAVPFQKDDIFVFYSDYAFRSNAHAKDAISRLLLEYENLSSQALLKKIEEHGLLSSQQNLSGTGLTLIVVKIMDNHLETKEGPHAKFKADLSQLKAVRSFIERACRQSPGPDTMDTYISQTQLAINEIFCNIVEHGYGEGEQSRDIIIQADYSKEGITFDIADQGSSFTPNLIEEPSLAGDNSRGFGWFIIREIADEVRYIPKSTPRGWNHIRIYKKFFYGEAEMEFEVNVQKGILVIAPKNPTLDAKDSPEFKEKVIELIDQNHCHNVVFNLSQMHFIDSSGLGSFLSILRTIHTRGGELKLACMSKPIRTMFELVSMHKIFEIFNSVDDAVQSF